MAAADRLVELGLTVQGIIYNGLRAGQPIGNNGDEEGRTPNGRVGFVISKTLEK